MSDIVPPIAAVAAQAATYLAERDPVLRRIIESYGPSTLEPRGQHFRSLVSAILGQQISVKAASAIRQRLESLVPSDDMSPANILALADEQLRAAGLSNAKVRYIRDLATRVADGRLDFDAVIELSDEDAIAALVSVSGIGRWTAEMFLIFSLGRHDILPVGDLGLRVAVARAYGLATAPTPEQLMTIAQPWRPYRTLATWYLWRSLESSPT